jgi:hypothetical protein
LSEPGITGPPIEASYEAWIDYDVCGAPLSRMVFAVLRGEGKRDPYVEGEVRATLDKSYAWLNRWMAGRERCH